MVTTQKEIQYAIGIEDLYICMLNGSQSVETLPTYEPNIYKQTNISDLTISANPSKFEKWASNKKIINIVKNSSYGLAFNLAGINNEVRDDILGKTSTKGISFETSDAKEFPTFAVGVVCPMNDGTKVARWYPGCSTEPAQESWKTQNQEMTVDDVAYTITANPLLFNNVTYVELDTGRANAAGVTVEDFMKQVVVDQSQLDTLFPAVTPPEGEED